MQIRSLAAGAVATAAVVGRGALLRRRATAVPWQVMEARDAAADSSAIWECLS